jgi:succinate dehydrogenase/fumarate reductase flavoprotein subunit
MTTSRNVEVNDGLALLERQQDFDVVVVGAGGAGATAAIEAAELGASVLVLEKTGVSGGNTQDSGGSFRLIVDRKGAIEHFWSLCQGTTPRDVIEVFIDGLIELPAWVEAHGGRLVGESGVKNYSRWVFPARGPGTSFPEMPGADSLGQRVYVQPTTPGRRRGAALWDFLNQNLTRLGVPVVLNARVSKLDEQDRPRAVVGVEVETSNGTTVIRARSGVILCSGGFAYDQALMQQYLGLALPAMSTPGKASGDGIRMAQAVGADLWHMSGVSMTVGYKFPDLEAGFHCRIPAYGFIMVDQKARRYVSETDLEGHSAHLAMLVQDSISGAYTRAPSFVVLDEPTRQAGPMAADEFGENRHYSWSDDNSAEIERGWIHRANTIDELAHVLGLPSSELKRSVDEFNLCATTKSSDPLGRSSERMRPIETPPFYGVAVYPSLVNTQGGPRRNARSAIVRPDGSPIPGLFGAGELGSIWNRLYPGAGNLSECLVFGRFAGRNAVTGAS